MSAARHSTIRVWLPRVAATALLLLVSIAARADEVDKLAEQLASASDFRVRTQAALALGASKNKRAVEPLCRGLDDSNTTVRAAAAAAIGKLRKGGEGCLKKRLSVETKDSVKSVINKALERLKEGAAAEDAAPSDKPIITDSTKYYVAVDTQDATGRGGDAVAKMVRNGVKQAASSKAEVAVAPTGETVAAAKKLLNGNSQLRGFLLSTKVKAPEYAGGALTIKFEVAIFTYPDKNLKGTFSRSLSMQGVTSRDPAAEDELIKTGAQRVLEMFVQTAPKIQ